MGRKIDISNLTDEDVPFLIQRPWIAKDAEHQGFEVPGLFYAIQNGGDHQPSAEGSPDHESVVEEQIVTGANLDEDGEETEDDEDGSEQEIDELDDNYDDLTVKELQKELKERDLSDKGNKDELIARLREDDELDEDDEVEES